jgi:glycosyl transferase, family 25
VTLADIFDCTFIINLAERTDRRRSVIRELKNIGIELAPGKVELFNAVRVAGSAGFPTAAVRGCFLSHRGVLREARKRGLRNVLIVEDDVAFSPLLAKVADEVQSALRVDWSFAYLGHVEEVTTLSPIRFKPYLGPLVTAHCYAVNGPVLDELLEFLQQVPIRPVGHPEGGPMHFDGALTMFRQAHPGRVTLISEPNLAWQRSSRSDIHSNWFQQAPFFGELYDSARFVRRLITGRR